MREAQVELTDGPAERGLLGALLLHSAFIDEAQEVLGPDDFANETYGQVFRTILKLHQGGRAADAITVSGAMGGADQAELDRVRFMLEEAIADAPPVGSLRAYLDLVSQQAERRRLLLVAEALGQAARDPEVDIADAREQAERLLYRQSVSGKIGLRASTDLFAEVLQEHELRRKEGDGALRGLATGFASLDRQYLRGLRPGQLIVIAGRPGMGKTQLGLRMARNIANEGGRVLVHSLEMPPADLLERILSSEADIPLNRIRDVTYDPADSLPILMEVAGRDGGRMSFIDPGSPTPRELESVARRLQRREGLDLIMIDYIQLLATPASRRQGRSAGTTRTEDVSEISRDLKACALALGVPIIALSQLSRGVESRVDKRPLLSDLRESGQIESDADAVLGIFREDYYDEELAGGLTGESALEVIVRKNRSGPLGTCMLSYHLATQSITDGAPAGWEQSLEAF